MTRLPVVAAMLIVATSVYGLRCYICDTRGAPPFGNSNCQDPFNISYANKTFMPQGDCSTSTIMPSAGCMKIVTNNVPYAKFTYRFCGFAVTVSKDSCNSFTVNGTTTTHCHCTSDYCNSAVSANSVLGSMILLVFIAHLLSVAY